MFLHEYSDTFEGVVDHILVSELKLSTVSADGRSIPADMILNFGPLGNYDR